MSSCAVAASRVRCQRSRAHQTAAAPIAVVPNMTHRLGNRTALSAAANRTTQTARGVAAAAASRTPVTMAASPAATVRIIIQGRKIEVTPAIRDYCEEKITKALSHFEGQIKEVDVKLSVRGGDAGKGTREQRTEITAYTLKHGVVRAEDVEENLYASVDLVCDKVRLIFAERCFSYLPAASTSETYSSLLFRVVQLQRKMRKLKEKAVDRGNWQGRGGKAGQTQLYEVLSSQDVVDDLELDRVAQLPKEVVRAKHVQLEPLTVEEATDRLEALGHDFYVFIERDSNTIQVLYQRKINGYGVIIPQDQ